MSLAPAPIPLIDLNIGDKVRVLDDSGERVQLVMDRRNIPAVAGWGGRAATTLIRLPGGSWYDCATGLAARGGTGRVEPA